MIKEENGMWMFEFGSGDIEVGSGLALSKSNEFLHCVSFTNQDAGEIGEVSERFKNIGKTSDFHFNALFTFNCIESIDVIIKHLEHCKKCMELENVQTKIHL